MVYYNVVNGEIYKSDEQKFWNCNGGICIFKLSEWNEGHKLRKKQVYGTKLTRYISARWKHIWIICLAHLGYHLK